MRARTYPGATRVTVDVEARPPGPWSIVETGAAAHTVRARRGRALTTPGGLFRRVESGPQAGRRVWTRATERAAPIIDEAVTALFDTALEG